MAFEQGSSCNEVKVNLQDAIAALPSPFASYNQMNAVLTATATSLKGTKIAIEMTSSELRDHLEGIKRFEDSIRSIGTECESIAQELLTIANVLYGPEYRVSQSFSIPLVAVENQEIKNENGKAFENSEL